MEAEAQDESRRSPVRWIGVPAPVVCRDRRPLSAAGGRDPHAYLTGSLSTSMRQMLPPQNSHALTDAQLHALHEAMCERLYAKAGHTGVWEISARSAHRFISRKPARPNRAERAI